MSSIPLSDDLKRRRSEARKKRENLTVLDVKRELAKERSARKKVVLQQALRKSPQK